MIKADITGRALFDAVFAGLLGSRAVARKRQAGRAVAVPARRQAMRSPHLLLAGAVAIVLACLQAPGA